MASSSLSSVEVAEATPLNESTTSISIESDVNAEDMAANKHMFEFITEGVLLIVISILGFIGNSMSIYVLLRPTVRGSFSNILMGLAAFDAMFLICAIVTFGLPTVSEEYKEQVFLRIMPVSYGLTHTARVGSVYATLSVTLERFFAIVFPFKDVDVVKRWLLPSTVIFTVVYNIPKFFEVTTTFDPATNMTVIVGTAMRTDPVYTSVYVVWSKLILTELVPYFTILILNSFIVVKIVKSSRFRAKILRNRNEHQNFQQEELGDEQLRDLEKQRQEHKLGILLVGISVLFICCQSFKIVPDLYEIMFCSDDSICYTTDFINTIVNLSHLLVCFNSSANFVIYLLGGEKFRRVWCQTYLCRRGQQFEDVGGMTSVRQQTIRMSTMQRPQLSTTTLGRGSSNTNSTRSSNRTLVGNSNNHILRYGSSVSKGHSSTLNNSHSQHSPNHLMPHESEEPLIAKK